MLDFQEVLGSSGKNQAFRSKMFAQRKRLSFGKHGQHAIVQVPLVFGGFVMSCLSFDVLDEVKTVVKKVDANAMYRTGGVVIEPKIIDVVLAAIPNLARFDVDREV